MKVIVLDQKAASLLPLADEYQIEGLKKLCVTELKKFAVPRLEYVSLGIIYNLDDLLSAAIETCAKKLGLEEIDRQQNLPENKEVVDDKVVLQVLRWVSFLHHFLHVDKDPNKLILPKEALLKCSIRIRPEFWSMVTTW